MSLGDFITRMERDAAAGFARLTNGIEEVVFADFPDYSNVGDSAIALGQAAFAKQQGIHLRAVFTAYSLRDAAIPQLRSTVMVNGGGSLGGLYGFHNQHRYRLAELLPSDCCLIQAPQSVHFPSEDDRAEFLRRFAVRANLRVGVRDSASHRLIESDVSSVLMPDAVHMLGRIAAGEPTAGRVVLARSDGESQDLSLRPSGAVDWVGRDTPYMRLTRTLNEQSHQIPGGRALDAPWPRRWVGRAERRFERGVRLIAQAETVVTDRLHGMLIALQMGRAVLAVDNSNGKLSAYAETWFGNEDLPLRFAASFEEAMRL